MHAAFLHYKLHFAPGFGEPIDVADRQYAGIVKAGQDLRAVQALRVADEQNVAAAKIVATSVLHDDDRASLRLLPRDDTCEGASKGVLSNNPNHDWGVRIVEGTLRPFDELSEVE